MRLKNINRIEYAGIWLPTPHNPAMIAINVYYNVKDGSSGNTQMLPKNWKYYQNKGKISFREGILIRNAVEVCEHINSSGRVKKVS